MRGTKEEVYGKMKAKKTRRIKWQDQLRPSSPFSINSNKNITKTSMPKGRLPSPAPTSLTFSNQAIQQ